MERPEQESYLVSVPSPDGPFQQGNFARTLEYGDVKLSADGEILLVPQPSDSPDDPLNWTTMKKSLAFFAILPGCMLSDWALTWGTTLFEAQAADWHMSVPDVARSVSGGIFMQGPGGLIAVPLAMRYGRLPVLFWSQFLSLIATIGATGAHSYAGFTACRTLQGFFGAAPQVIGLCIIHDMFFLHQRAQVVNIWAACFLVGPYIGPFISAFLLQVLSWRESFAVLCGCYGFSVLMVLLFAQESIYDRTGAGSTEPRSRGLKRRAEQLVGITGVFERLPNVPSLLHAAKMQAVLLTYPQVLLPTLGFVTWQIMWVIGIVTTISQFVLPPPYSFSPTAFALLFLAPMIGTGLAEGWGHWFGIFWFRRHIAHNGGRYRPEIRLTGVYLPWLLGIVGLIIYGQTLQHSLHWAGLAFGWGLVTFAALGTTASVSHYLLDIFPRHAALVSAWINFFRTLGGFSVVYFQLQWVGKSGPAVTFGCQAAIVGFFIVSIITTQVMGEQWRRQFPAPALQDTETSSEDAGAESIEIVPTQTAK